MLLPNYEKLWDNLLENIPHENFSRVLAVSTSISVLLDRYTVISKKTRIPRIFIALVHHMESGSSFTKHLHNGDPLTQRTVHVPKGRPIVGNPPFSFEQSAVDALSLMKLDNLPRWDIKRMLYRLEAYNGFAYWKYKKILTPYLWNGSLYYKKGKYVADGKFDPNAVSKQLGAAVLLKVLLQVYSDIADEFVRL